MLPNYRLATRHPTSSSKATERYSLEENIHQIIFPIRSDSYDVLFEQQNLWIIDEKLTFHRYLASDTRLDKQETHEGTDRQRPDLVIWNNPFSLSEEDSVASLNSVTIVEFKQPGKEDYSDAKNPVAQVYNYVDRIRAGKAKSHAGRVLTVRENTPFYAYILCDLFPHLCRKLIHWQRYKRAVDAAWTVGPEPGRPLELQHLSCAKTRPLVDRVLEGSRLCFWTRRGRDGRIQRLFQGDEIARLPKAMD